MCVERKGVEQKAGQGSGNEMPFHDDYMTLPAKAGDNKQRNWSAHPGFSL